MAIRDGLSFTGEPMYELLSVLTAVVLDLLASILQCREVLEIYCTLFYYPLCVYFCSGSPSLVVNENRDRVAIDD